MGHDNAVDTGRERCVDGAVNLGPAEVPGGEHEIVARDNREHCCEGTLRQLHRRAPDPGLRELLLDLPPNRLLGRFLSFLARFVLGVDRGQPDDPRATARRDLDRLCVQPADAGVERDCPEGAYARHGRTHDCRPFRRRRVVRLEHEARQPELGEAACQPEVVDAPLREVGLDVDVEVVGAANELARPLGGPGGRFSARQGAHPPQAPEEFL
jgi:hypothetical protein